MLLSIVTPNKKLIVDQELEEVFVPAEKGELNILPGHAPLLSTLTTGLMRYRLKGESEETKVVISWGFVEVAGDTLSILAETAESESEIDLERAEDAYKRAQERMNMANLGENELEKLQRKMKRAQARLDVKN